MNITDWYELAALALFFILFIIGIERMVQKRIRYDREQWELGDSCLRRKEREYRRNFGIADVRTLRKEN